MNGMFNELNEWNVILRSVKCFQVAEEWLVVAE